MKLRLFFSLFLHLYACQGSLYHNFIHNDGEEKPPSKKVAEYKIEL